MRAEGLTISRNFLSAMDEAWLKTTLAAYDPALDGPRLSYEEVDLSLIEPRKRDYTTVHEVGKRRASKEA